MSIEPIVVGGTYDWFLNPAMINTRTAPNVYGIWDITGATITISFLYYGNGPDAAPTTSYHYSATILSGSDGTASYINSASLFNVVGHWGVSWKISLSGTILETDIYRFMVKASGAAA